MRVTLVAYLIALAWIVFAPGDDAGRVTGIVGTIAHWVSGWTALSPGEAYVPLEFLANVALFVPFGILSMLVLPRRRPLLVVALGLATTITIELVQLAIPDRVSTISDVLANTLGTLVGVAVITVAGMTKRRRAQPVAHPE